MQSSPINEDAEDAQEAAEPTVRSPQAESSLSSPHSAHDGVEESAPELQLETEQKNDGQEAPTAEDRDSENQESAVAPVEEASAE